MSKKKQLAQEYKDKGNKSFAAEKYSEAISFYSKAIDNDPADHVLYSNRSAAHMGSKDFARALADADQCIKLKSDWSKGYFRKASALMSLNRYNEAVEILNAGLKVDPANADLKKKLEEAKVHAKPITKATGLDAKKEGNEHFKLSRYELAIESYNVALATIEDPNERSVIYSNKAACYHQLRAYDDVIRDATESLTLNQTNTKSLLRRGLAYEAMEKPKHAINDLQQVAELEPGTALAKTASEALHRIKAAQARFERAGK
jgi:stress-induced-phosphoprotein 1